MLDSFHLITFVIPFWSSIVVVASNDSPKCENGLVLPAWKPQDDITTWDRVFRGTIYFVSMIYLFLGVSIVSDRFMGAIEVITSQEREIVIRKKNSIEGQKIKVRVWNETVANLTLMALGSSAPEILLSIIEIVGKNFEAGDLGPGTIVGSAAYNLFVIIALCIYVVPDGEVRKIKHLTVFFVTAFWSIFAYIWLYLILAVISKGVVECWEGFLTFMFFPATVFTAYMADKKLKIMKFKKFRLNRNRVIVAAESGDITMEKEIEDEILEESSITDPHHFAIILRDLKKRNSNATSEQLEKLASEELAKRTHKSKAFYRLQANKNITGGVAQTVHPKKEHVQQETVISELPDTKVYFNPDYYTVFENVGELDVTVVREGIDLSQTVTVFYTTEDGTAIAGSDYEGASGTIVFTPGETRKTITLNVIDDDIFEEDEHFYLHLTKASISSLNGNIDSVKDEEPSVILANSCTATIVILDDDHCGVFGFANESVEISENVGVFNLEVIRSSGARGKVKVEYTMQEHTAKYEQHFIRNSGALIFEDNEARKEINIEIVEEDCYEKNVSFFVQLENVTEITNEENNRGDQINNDSSELRDEEKIALRGKPKLGSITKIEIIIRENDEFKNTVNKLVEQEGPAVGFSSWSEQFTNAFRVKVDEEEMDENAKLTWCDYFTHLLTFVWKLLFALVPPPDGHRMDRLSGEYTNSAFACSGFPYSSTLSVKRIGLTLLASACCYEGRQTSVILFRSTVPVI
ncbi:hypothetical protein PGB90_006604 [Kerria lacca]